MRRSQFLIALLVLSLAASGAARAGWDEGVAAFKAGNFTQALKEFEAVAAERPDWPGGHLMVGRCLMKLNRSQQAVSSLRKAYDLAPSDVATQLTLGQAYLDSKLNGDAAQLLSRANPAGMSKDQQSAYYQLYATALGRAGNEGRALDELGKASRANPNDADLQYRYGTMALNANETAIAVAALEKAARLDTKDSGKSKLYVQALIRSAREGSGAAKDQAYIKAAEAARSLVARQPDYDSLLLLGEAQLGAGQYDAAVAAFDQAAAKNAADWLPHFYIGQAQTASGNWTEAETALKKAIGKAPAGKDQVRIWKQLGFVYEKQKNYTQAKVAYQNAGDGGGVDRIVKQQEIAAHNQQADEEAEKAKKLAAEAAALREKLKDEGPPPPRR